MISADDAINNSKPAAGPDRNLPSATDIAAVCAGIAGLDLPADADLFLSGLNSLDLVRVVGVIERDFGVLLTALDILDHPTAEQLADHVRRTIGDDGQR
jgi:acyl carrier protein